jgi:hypothetical protein
MKKQKFVLRNDLIPKGNTYRQKVCKSNHYLSITKYLLIKTLSLFLKEKGFIFIDRIGNLMTHIFNGTRIMFVFEENGK